MTLTLKQAIAREYERMHVYLARDGLAAIKKTYEEGIMVYDKATAELLEKGNRDFGFRHAKAAVASRVVRDSLYDMKEQKP